jgi:hypothetical protein
MINIYNLVNKYFVFFKIINANISITNTIIYTSITNIKYILIKIILFYFIS